MENTIIVTVRSASRDDLSLLTELSRTTFRSTFAQDNTPEDMEAYLTENLSEEKIGRELSDPLSTFLIAERDGRPLGYAKLSEGTPDASVTGARAIELVRVYVLTEIIGSGIGARLMKECIGSATRRGYETIWLGVWENNSRAIDFYHRWGFSEVGSHLFQLGSDPQTDLILQKSLRG